MINKVINWTQVPASQYPIFKRCKKTNRIWHKGKYHESIYTDGEFYYHKDPLHGEVEKYDKKGKHCAVLLPTGELHPIKRAVKGRTIKNLL